MRQAVCLLGLLVAVTGCEVRTPVAMRDGGNGTVDGEVLPTGCTPGSPGFRCNGNEAVECLADGSEGDRTNCTATGQVCAQGIGCTTCVPNTFQCNGNNVERCNHTGTGWEQIDTCDPAAGQMCNASLGLCRSLCEDAASSNSYIGCEYWPTFTLNSQVEESFKPAVVVANPQTAPATVTISGGAGAGTTRTVAPGATETIVLEWNPQLKGTYPSEASALVPNGAYRLVSTLPVTVYQFNPLEYESGGIFSHTNDASLLLPSHAMTGNYLVLARPTMMHRQDGTLSSSPSYFTIVGVSATPVTVNIQFSAHTLAGTGVTAFGPGETGTFTLNQGDVVQFVAGKPSSCTPGYTEEVVDPDWGFVLTRIEYCAVGAEYDFTGTEVRASGPVQVIAGHNCAFVPYNRWACDHLEEALFPLEAWGTESIVSASQPLEAEPNVVRIVSGADGNVLTFDPVPAGVANGTTLNRGQTLEFETTQSFRVSGTEALLVGQFLVGQDYTGIDLNAPENREGDPSFSLAIPSEQYRTEYTFLAPSTFTTNFVNVTAPVGATVMLDGTQVTGFQPVGGTGFQTARVSIAGGQHSITGAQPFGIVVYGFGSYTSYMYPGGLDLEAINIPF